MVLKSLISQLDDQDVFLCRFQYLNRHPKYERELIYTNNFSNLNSYMHTRAAFLLEGFTMF